MKAMKGSEASGSFAFDPAAWAEESFEAGVEIYRMVKQGAELTEEQVEEVQTILKKQICKAGKRLAGSFERVYKKVPPAAGFYFVRLGFGGLLGGGILDGG